MGWQCPACQRCFAPHIQQCFYCPVALTTSDSTSGTYDGDLKWVEEILSASQSKNGPICGGGPNCKCRDGFPG